MAEKSTRLKIWRLRHKLTHAQMSMETGIPLRTYQRLEAGGLSNPPIRYLMNCAVVHGVPLEEVCEPEWLEWTEFVAGVRHPHAAPPPASP